MPFSAVAAVCDRRSALIERRYNLCRSAYGLGVTGRGTGADPLAAGPALTGAGALGGLAAEGARGCPLGAAFGGLAPWASDFGGLPPPPGFFGARMALRFGPSCLGRVSTWAASPNSSIKRCIISHPKFRCAISRPRNMMVAFTLLPA